jgi:hypothetical protein
MKYTLGADCIGYPTVTKYLRERSFSKSMVDTDFEPKIEEEDFIDEAILGALEECPIFLTPPDFQQNTHSNEYGSILFG